VNTESFTRNSNYGWLVVIKVKPRWVVLIAILLLVGAGPFFVPVQSSGTLTNDELSSSLMTTGSYRTHVEITDSDADTYFLLLHGFGASSFSWRDVTGPLSAFGTVIAYDRPAFGLTDRPTEWVGIDPYSSDGALEQLDSLIEQLVPANAPLVLVGHSAGGTVAAQYALDNPGKIDALILVAPAILTTGGSPGWLNWLFSVPQIDHLGPLLVSTIASSGLEVLDRSFTDPSKITPELLAGYQQPLTVIGWERAFWQFNKAERSFDVAERLDELRLPVVVITCDDDRIVATADSVRLAMLLPNAKLATVTQTGHLPHEELPSEFMRLFAENYTQLSR
jgi:pimeloyl-ACP methyl ester carboxylesterase